MNCLNKESSLSLRCCFFQGLTAAIPMDNAYCSCKVSSKIIESLAAPSSWKTHACAAFGSQLQAPSSCGVARKGTVLEKKGSGSASERQCLACCGSRCGRRASQRGGPAEARPPARAHNPRWLGPFGARSARFITIRCD